MKKQIAAAALAVLMAGSVFGVVPASAAVYTKDTAATAAARTQIGSVNWEKGDRSDVTASGTGVAPAGMTGVRAKLLARRAALLDAYRNLAETVAGVQLDADTTMQDLAVASDVVKTHTEAMIQGARIVKESENGDGSYTITLSVPLYGVGSVASVAMPELRTSAAAAPLPVVKPETASVSPEETADLTRGTYTGIVVDAAGLGLQPTFAPVIYDETGRVVYGLANLDYDYAINHGMAAYATSVAGASESRGGSHPLVVKALSVRGGKNSKNPVNVVVSKADGDRILLALENSTILKRAAVVLVR